MPSTPARSRSPYYTSAGQRHFSLRMTSRGGSWSRGFEWDSNFVRCLILLTRMISCTAGILRPSWIISLVTQNGASKIALNILEWQLYMTAILDLQTQPHNSMSYVHMGIMMDLYSRNLLSIERWNVLPRNQWSSLCMILFSNVKSSVNCLIKWKTQKLCQFEILKLFCETWLNIYRYVLF